MIKKDDFRNALDMTLDKVLTVKIVKPIADDETFEEYGMDSLDQMNMLLELEDAIGVDLSEAELGQYDTPEKLLAYANTQAAAN